MAATCAQGKESWPELVGQRGEVAVAIVERENPTVDAVIFVKGRDKFTEDFGCRRVRVIVNQDGVVVDVPVIG